MKAVVLAAGKGSRLYPVTHHIAKPLLPLANKPTLAYVFERLREIGATDICLVVGENEPQMREGLGDGSLYDVELTYVRQSKPLGLAHALGFARDFVGGEDFVMYLGDGIYSDSFEPFANRFRESGCANLNIVQAVPDPQRYGIANTDGERIVKLVEKPKEPESNLAMAGVYFFNARIWEVLTRLIPSARGEFEITDAIQLLIDQGDTVLAGIYKGTWFDTGTLDSFLATSAYLTGGGVIVGHDSVVKAETGLNVVVGEGAFVRCATLEDSVILPGAHIETTGNISHSILGGNWKGSGEVQGQIIFGEKN